MIAISRPLRAVGLILGFWVCGRAVILSGQAGAWADRPDVFSARVSHLTRAVVARQLNQRRRSARVLIQTGLRWSEKAANRSVATSPDVARVAMRPHPSVRVVQQRAERRTGLETTSQEHVAKNASGGPFAEAVIGIDRLTTPSGHQGREASPQAVRHLRSRLTVSGWSLMRSSGARGLGDSGQLGGSQIGARATYALDTQRRFGLTARASAPLNEALGKEIAIGFMVKPLARLPLQIIAERRVALDAGGRNTFAVLATGGVYNQHLVGRLTMSGYVQAGVVGRDAFVDGATEFEQPIAAIRQAKFAAGAGVWGAAQPGVRRLDVGPELVLHTRIGQASARLSASYRARVLGDARPHSGAVLSLGADF